ncbi:MAG TPA: TetR/AcrR family transcriptional regulator [Acidimicrobiales bacterium]|nr:TetR/AcrR family transcriptional regulator [Acidimicrobiales bacterium]
MEVVGGPGRPAEGRELRARGVETMHRLLTAGVTVFGRRGLHAARVDDIVKAANTSHGTFYRYFASKEDLFRALTTDVADRLGELADSLGEIGPGPEGAAELRAWVARFRDVYDQYGPVIQTWTEAEQDDTPEGRLGADVLAQFVARLAERIRAAGVTAVDADVAAVALVAMIERLTYYSATRQVPADTDAVTEVLATAAQRSLFGPT